MKLICPTPSCPHHRPNPTIQWYDYHGSYSSCGVERQRYKCRCCGRTFSERTLSINYWAHFDIDYTLFISLIASGLSVRGLSRYFEISVKTVQNRIGRLARTIIPTVSVLQESITLTEHLVADGLENFCVSQDFPNNIHLLVGKDSQFTYGINYALMRRKGTMTDEQKERCKILYKQVDFSKHTIQKTFSELIRQMNRVAGDKRKLRLYTDERVQYQNALAKDRQIQKRIANGRFKHIRISSKAPRTIYNDLFSVNYTDREIRKDVPEYHRETVCFGRNVSNSLDRLCVYLFHHNFVKLYRIDVKGEDRTHAEVAGLSRQEVRRIRSDVITRRRFLSDGEVRKGSFYNALWRRLIPTPLKKGPEYLQKFALV